jgi:peptide/nickel transport system substrate-binding protein
MYPARHGRCLSRHLQAGFTVDLQVIDWASVLARRTKKEGWSVHGVHAGGFDLASLLTNVMVGFNCVDFTGWQCDPRITPLLDAFAKAPAEEDRKKIAAEIQTVMYDQARALRGAVRAAGRLSHQSARLDTVCDSDFQEHREVTPCMTSL